jgi:hypothetical protein
MANVLLGFQVWMAAKDLHKRRADFYYDLGATLQDRVPLVTTLRKYEMRARYRHPGTAPMYMEMLKGLQTGSLSNALRAIASPVELTLIDATQASGDSSMAEGLLFMSQTVEKTDKMLATIRKALVYPIALLMVFALMLTGFSLSAVPMLAELMPPSKWPPLGKLLYTVSNVVAHQGVWIAAGLVLSFTLFIYSLGRWTGPVRQRLDRYFPYSVYRDYSGSLMLISISSMMRSGVSLRSALERSMKFSSPWLRWHLRKILSNLSKPNNPHFGQSFCTGVLSQELEDRVQDASERRDPVDSFVRMGVGSIDRLVLTMERRAARINSGMIVVCGILLATMMAGFLSTTMSLQSAVRDSAQGSSATP